MPRALLLAVVFAGVVPAGTASAAGSPATGRLLVTLDRGVRPLPARAFAATAGARPVGFAVPRLRLVTVAPRRGESLRVLRARLRADPRVLRVESERRASPRLQPGDPALTAPETARGVRRGTTVE